MPVSIVQLVVAAQDATSGVPTWTTGTLTNAPTTGNHLILFLHTLAKQTLSSVTDSAGNTWQVDVTAAGTTNVESFSIASCYITNALTTSSTISGTLSSNNNSKLSYVFEVAGLATSAWFGSASADYEVTVASTSRTSNSIAAATVGDLIIGAWGVMNTETGLTATSPFTALPTATGPGYFSFSGANPHSAEGVYLIATDTSAQTPATTGNANRTYNGRAATYKAAAVTAVPRRPAINFQDPAIV